MVHHAEGIVADGYERAHDGAIEQLRAEVEAKCAEELKTAGVWKRLQIRRRVEKEVRERMRKIAPPAGLYWWCDYSRVEKTGIFKTRRVYWIEFDVIERVVNELFTSAAQVDEQDLKLR